VTADQAAASPLPADGTSRRPSWGLLAVLYASLVTSISAALVLHRYYRFDGLPISFGRALLWQAAIYCSWGALVPLIAWAGRRFARRRSPRAGGWLASLPAYLIAGIVIAPAHAALSAVVTWLARPVAGTRPPFMSVAEALFIERVPVDLLIYWAIVGVLYAITYGSELRRQERAAAVLEAELARAQLRMLKTQLQPHFLFNTLQGIATLIRHDPDSAVSMTARLGDLLRVSLERSGDQEVSLRDELSLLRTYLEIESMRYGNRLRIEYDVAPEALDCRVPDLLLQPLVENAIRHGIAPRARGGRLMIAAHVVGDRLHVRVEDDGVGLPRADGEEAIDGLGLGITRNRLAHLHPDHHFRIAAAPEGIGVRVDIEIPARGMVPQRAAAAP
jgi:signal transduction histidine kinase